MDLSMAASSSSAAADPSLLKYDVFISFRGETRNSFTSHLYFALCQKRINAYIDEVSLGKGDDIERALPKAIEVSAISIIIFSKDYASSRWCLDELVHILKCWEEKNQIVLPIFYDIDPSHIRHQKETYAAAFDKHQKLFEDKIVQEWRQALRRAAGLSGWDSRGKSERLLVQDVVEHVISKLQSISSPSIDDLKGLFGIPRQLLEIESLLFFDSPDVLILGIWGMGGIGKTTLARIVFERFSNWFDGACFLENVRERLQGNGLEQLEREMFSTLLGVPFVSCCFSNDRLGRTKALLVLDDVDNIMQLERLVKSRLAKNVDGYRFARGSKIILTSRDLLALKTLGQTETYEVQALNQNEASQLFYSKAFTEKCDRSEYEKMSAEVVSYTGGNPLALKVLGSYLKSLDGEVRKSALENLTITPHLNFQNVLRSSYDGLHNRERDVFLDIACFFVNKTKDFVAGILGGRSIEAINVLVNKSLITVNQYGLIRMHDLIREMGWEIVRESTKKLGKRSRLWTAEDVSYVLENNKGTDAIEGIYLPWIKKEIRLRPDVFKEMDQLRLLKICNAREITCWDNEIKVHIDGDLEYLPEGLRYLHWQCYPGQSWPSKFQLKNLVELHMPCSKLWQLWDGVLELGSLKRFNLSHSSFISTIPDLSKAPKLESINLYDCERLRTLPKVSGNIRELVLMGTALKELPSSIESLENLLILDLNSCSSLESLPNLPRNIEELDLRYTRITRIPLSSSECPCNLRKLHLGPQPKFSREFYQNNLCEFTRLQELDLSYSNGLIRFPMLSGFCYLTNLNLTRCGIWEIPDWLGSLTSLTKLHLSGNSFVRMPESIGMLYNLKELIMFACFELQSLPELPLFIETVCAESCISLEMVSTSRSTLTLGRWLDNYDSGSDNYQREFSFLNCIKLGEDAINNIFREFLYKVFCTATTPLKVVDAARVTSFQKKKLLRGIGKVVVCYPSKEIPGWFNKQSEGSSITIELPRNWYNPKKLLGFVVSVVVASENSSEHPSVKCKLHLRKKYFRVNEDDFNEDDCGYAFRSTLEHNVMWYNYFDHSKVKFEEEYEVAVFKFDSPGLNVKRCGVRMLYLSDAIENSEDGTTADFESWIIEKSDDGTSANRSASDDDDQSGES